MAETSKNTMLQSKAKNNKKRMLIAGLAIILIGGGGYYGYQKWMKPTTAQAAFQEVTVGKGTVTETVLASGTVQASKRSSLSFSDVENAKDVISSINVQIGDHVKAGQVLATMDDSVAKLQVINAQANLLSAQAKLEEAQKRKTSAEMGALEANVTQAKAELDAAKLGLDSEKAGNDLAKAKASLDNAQKTFNSQKALYEAGAISKTDYDSAQDSLAQAQRDYNTAVLTASQTKSQSAGKIEQAQAAYDNAVEALNEAKEGPDSSTILSAKASVEQAKAQLQQNQKALNAVTLKAPMDGVIVQLNGNVGEVPGNDFIVMDNSNSGDLEVMAQISESDIGKVQVGQNVAFTTSSYTDKKFSGKVKLIYPEAKTNSGVTTYDVLLSVENKEGLLKIGMTMNVTIEIGTHSDVLVIPASALQTRNGKDGVFLVTDTTQGSASSTEAAADGQENQGQRKNSSGREGRMGGMNMPFRFHPVKIGYFASDRVEITDGLKEGDKVAIIIPTATGSASAGNQNVIRMGGFGSGGFGGGGFSGGGGGMRVRN